MILSVLVPLYNSEKYIDACLRSVLNQGLNESDYEIIIVNDGSTDNGLKIVNRYAEIYKNIFVHSQKNAGLGAVRNKGIGLAKGRYIYFLDSDDYLASNVLKTIIDQADKYELEVLGFKSRPTKSYDLYDSNSMDIDNEGINVWDGVTYIAENGFKNEVWWYIINREFLLKTGIRFIEGRWVEDTIFTSSLFIKTKRIAFVPMDVHRHVDVPTSAMNNKEPNHYVKVIRDNAHAAVFYEGQINKLSLIEEPAHQNCVKRLKTRQESFVFFLTARALKSDLKFNQLWDILKKMEEIGAYPMRNFISSEYNGLVFYVLIKIFNNKGSLYVSFMGFSVFRMFKKMLRMF